MARTPPRQAKELFDRQPPSDTKIEKAALGSILIDPQKWPAVSSRIQVSDFYDAANATIFRAIKSCMESDGALDVTLLRSKLKDAGEYDKIGGGGYLSELIKAAPHAAHAEYYADIIAELSGKRKILGLGYEFIQAAWNGQPSAEIIAGAEEDIAALASSQRVRIGQPNIVELADIEEREITWIWEGRTPRGMVTLLDGDPDLGKSTILLDLTARTTTGRPMPPGDGPHGTYEPANVLLLSAEDDPARTIVKRLRVAGADLARVSLFKSITERDYERLPVLPDDLERVADLITEKNIFLVIVDPLMSFMGEADSHKAQDVQRLFHRLKQLAEATQAAIVVVRHLNKTAGIKSQYRGGGSIGIIGAVRSALLVGQPVQNGPRYLAVNKSNLCEKADTLEYEIQDCEGVARILWKGANRMTPDEILGEQPPHRTTKADQCADLLADLLADGPVEADKARDRCKAEGFSNDAFRKARTILKVVPTKGGYQGQWTIELPGSKATPLPKDAVFDFKDNEGGAIIPENNTFE